MFSESNGWHLVVVAGRVHYQRSSTVMITRRTSVVLMVVNDIRVVVTSMPNHDVVGLGNSETPVYSATDYRHAMD